MVVGDPAGNQAPTVIAAADPRTGTAPLTVDFSSHAVDPDGDGGQAAGSKAARTYTAPGTSTAAAPNVVAGDVAAPPQAASLRSRTPDRPVHGRRLDEPDDQAVEARPARAEGEPPGVTATLRVRLRTPGEPATQSTRTVRLARR